MNVKSIALMALKAMDMMTGRRYWGKSPGEVVAMRLSKKKQDKARRQRRKRWSYRNRRFPCSSHRRN